MKKNKFHFKTMWDKVGTIIIFFFMLIVFSFFAPKNFLSSRNLLQIATQSSVTLLLACGEFFAILIGGIELSIGSVAALCGMVSAQLMTELGMNYILAFIIGSVLMGALCGLINGTLINITGVHPFIITLGTQSVFRALTLIVTSNQNRRYDADMLCLKSVLDRGVLGELVKFESHYDYYRPQGWYHYFGVLYNLAVHTIDQVISLFGKPDWTNYDVRSIIFPGEADDYYDLEFHYGKLKATVNTSMLCAIDYPRFTVHGTKGSLTLPPVLHNSSKKKTEGRFKANRQPAGEDRWGTLVYFDDEGIRHEEKVPVGCAHYERVYENLIDCICNGGEKAIKDEEVITVLEILEEATAVAKKWSK